ncbi:MAG: sensor histidine kinase [Pyrinomonadaceae bacterium]
MTNIKTYRDQETVLILLNIAVLAALFFVHIGFISLLGRPSLWLLVTLATRFVILVVELLWLQRLPMDSPASYVNIHVFLSIALNISFAFLAAIAGGTADSHYSVLMIIPILSAAYRFSLARTLTVTAVTIVLTFFEVWLFFRANPPIDVSEFFEAATVSLIFLVVAIVVWLLVGSLRREEEKLEQSLQGLRVLQEKLVAEEKLAAVGQLSSAIAHEIRNPVTMIASSLKMAEKHEPGSAIRLEMFNIAAEESKRLETLTTDFLAFARTKEPHLKPVLVSQTLDYIASLAKARLVEKGLTLDVQCDQELSFAMDESLMQQALLNLLTNAINAVSSNGKIIMGACKERDTSVLFLENEGNAIPDDMVPRIFEPFFTNGVKGTGLGLSIVRNIARAHGGDVILAANENGKVRFEIRF